ncbi:MAG: 2-hydroxycarboxylate transporter family protein [Phytoplasma sp.]|uniref:2-hydroxycarboxylate transporter family protein n=1 Tax=Phytoplasma sp. TaxID=2155 RepID=UPI002B41063D|nr:2-hydroxycarboxylate transporter family protein [Phytoplasma sp.]WRH06558.1 MAG: 2-hydroxycarboxylate transporter family protein [Phytoplasma sp.]
MKTISNSDITSLGEKKNKKIIILGFSLSLIIMILFLILVHVFLSYNHGNIESPWHNFMSMLLFIMFFAGILKFIGSKTPILKNIGGGPILCLLIPAFVFHYNFGNDTFQNFQEQFIKKADFFGKNDKSIGFTDFFISSLIVGSLIGIKKEFLGKMLKKFLPLVIISLTISALFVGTIGFFLQPIKGLGAASTKNNFLDSIFYIFIPISCGGITCGIIPLSKIFSQVNNGGTEDAFKAHILPSLLIAGIFSVIVSGLIKKIWGQSKYSSPNKMLEKNMATDKENIKITPEIKKTEFKISYENITTGLIATFSFYILSGILREGVSKLFQFIPILNKVSAPPIIIFLVILVIIFKFFDLISAYYVKCIDQSSKFITTNFTSAIFFLLGIGTDFNKIKDSMFNLSFVLICLLCVIITALSAAIIGNKFGYYPVQSAISAGLCSNSIGGIGNIAILEASDSMELSPYAQISTRIGGDIIVILTSILFPLIYC